MEVENKIGGVKSSKSKTAADFSAHLKRIKAAKKLADKASCGKSTIAEATIEAAWELLFDFFCRTPSENFELSDLNTLSGVIHKLVSSENGAKAKSSAASETKPAGEITEDVLRKIEKKLKLL
ncbi:hypothetical protein [Intestinicryptomonas porci]|uniref:Uncharacterized protein n=1 Tax=Intestinicryptomonas porci TaxID=2926320 RepID=A0ABU4WHZ9_9BACT|nr:hypothetical protein [Opitutales bacterium CLA-KB-P66]